jgi:hypothetical protein
MRRSSARRRDIKPWLKFFESPGFAHGFGVFLGVVLLLVASPRGDAGRARFSRVKVAQPTRRNSNLYLAVGCFLLILEALYFWFGIDVFSVSTYR